MEEKKKEAPKTEQKNESYDQFYLDLFETPPGQGAQHAHILSIPIDEVSYHQIKSQISKGKTILTARKENGEPQIWVVGHPFFSASVRAKKLSSKLYVPDGSGGFSKKGPDIKVVN